MYITNTCISTRVDASVVHRRWNWYAN